MKKIISFILLSCMLLNITTAFAENNVNTTEDSNIINTDVLSDENVLYKVIQEIVNFRFLDGTIMTKMKLLLILML